MALLHYPLAGDDPPEQEPEEVPMMTEQPAPGEYGCPCGCGAAHFSFCWRAA